MWPHPQASSHLLSGPAFVNSSTRYHTPAALMTFWITLCTTLLPFTTTTTDDTAIYPFCLPSRMVWWFACHRTWVGIAVPVFTASNPSHILCRPSVSIRMYRTRGTSWIVSLSLVSFSLTFTTPVLTVLAAVMVMSWYHIVISTVVLFGMIAVIVPFALLLAFMILMWAGACGWKSALLIADAISWSIILGSGTLWSVLRIRHLSAMLEPGVAAWAGLTSFPRFHGGTVSHSLVGVGTDVVTPFGVDVTLCISTGVGLGVCAGFGFRGRFGFGFGIGIDLGCLPGCSCSRSSGLFGPPVCVGAVCIEASRPIFSGSAFLFSLWSRSVAATTLTSKSMMPLPHSTSSWWYASCFSSFSSIHVFIPCHCASCSAVGISSIFAIFAMVRCSCASSRAYC